MIELPVWLWLQSLIQGITEFLPVSSTGHLGLSWAFLTSQGFEVPSAADQQVIDIALHVGTLFAVMIYFIRDVGNVLAGGLALLRPQGTKEDPRIKLFITLLIASIPVMIFGLLIAEVRDEFKNNLSLIAATTIVFGVLLWIADKYFWSTNKIRNLSYFGAAFIGIMQCLALIPGVSRSGITMTAGRFLGLERVEATRFSMLLSIPTIGAAGGFGAIKLMSAGGLQLTAIAGLAALLSFLAALIAIHILMELSKRSTFLPFVLYRIALGLLIYTALVFDWVPMDAAI